MTHLTPAPLFAQPLGGELVLDSTTRIEHVPGAKDAAEFLAAFMRRGTAWSVPLRALPAVKEGTSEAGSVIRFVEQEPAADLSTPDAGTAATLSDDTAVRLLGDAPTGQSEAYSLSLEGTEVLICATTAAGWFWAVQSLRQLLPAELEAEAAQAIPALSIAAVQLVDAPRFPYRGMMLDVARSFFTVDQVKRHLDLMASFKFNVLHLHLSDDQAWRIQINNPTPNPSGLDFEALTRVGGLGAVSTPGVGLSPGLTGYFTQADYSEIVRHAAALHIVVVPEIDVPGHVNAALAALPALNPDGVAKAMNTTGEVGYSTLDAQNPLTRIFVQEVFSQLSAITPGPYLHIGGDEAHVTGKEDYLAMVSEFAHIAAQSKVVIGWNEYAQAQLPTGAVVQYWHGDLADTLRQVRDNGAKVVMSPGAGSYLDQKYVSEDPIGLEWAGIGDWDTYYGWEPVLEDFTQDQVLGVESPLWTETVRGTDQANWLLYPRAIAIAELGWSVPANRDAQSFAERLGGLGKRLLALDVTFRPSPGIPWNAQPRNPFAEIATADSEE